MFTIWRVIKKYILLIERGADMAHSALDVGDAYLEGWKQEQSAKIESEQKLLD